MTNRFLKQSNADVGMIVDLLKAKKVGEIITYDQIQDVCIKTKNIQEERGALQTALKKLHHEGFIFYSERGIGYKRATPEQIVKMQPFHLRRAKKIIRKSSREIDTVDENLLSPDLRKQKILHESLNNILTHVSKPTNVKIIERNVIGNRLPQLPADILRIINKEKPKNNLDNESMESVEV